METNKEAEYIFSCENRFWMPAVQTESVALVSVLTSAFTHTTCSLLAELALYRQIPLQFFGRRIHGGLISMQQRHNDAVAHLERFGAEVNWV